MLSTRYTVIRSTLACTRPSRFTMHCNPLFFHKSQTWLSPWLSFLFMPVVQKDRCAGYLLHNMDDWIHQFLATVVLKQFSKRQQANPLCLHCLEEAQCASGVLPLCSANTPVNFTVLKETIWSGSQVEQDNEFSWKCAGQRGETGDCKPPSCAGDARLEQRHPGPSSYTETHT